MEPSLSVPCNGKKRKDNTSATQEKVKRLKTEMEGYGTFESAGLSHPPRISVLPSHLQEPVTLEELTELLHFAALGKSGGVKQPSWCRLRHQRRVKGVNVVVLDGLTQSHFYKHYLTLPHLRNNYTTRLSFTPSSNNLASGIFSSEVPGWESSPVFQREEESRHLHEALKWHPVIRRFGTETRGLTAYTLTQEEMIKKHFPVKGMPGFEGFACTDSDDCVTDSSPLYGIDCEMCLTEKGHELARVSLVDSDGRCVLDDLVKPQSRVLNYLTRFSGITAAMLRPITTTLREVQTKLRMLLPRDAVLVGHSLDNDLRALNLIHPHVIDTSLLYRKEFGQRFKLRVLAETVLKREIQSEEKKGHNPTEDALAALELAQYFIKTGPRQVVQLQEELWGGSLTLSEPTVCESTPTQSYRFSDVLQKNGQSVTFIGKRADIILDLSNQQWHNSDKEVLASFRRKTKCPFFSVLHFSSLSDHLNSSSPHQEQHYQRVCANLREMCIVFAGPFPAGFSEREVRRLFRCCGPVRKIKMLNTTVRIHAEIEFELLEGAMLAVETLNGLHVHGQHIKVQRPVSESSLDLDLTLDALMRDPLNANHLYAVRLKPNKANHIHISATANGHTLDAKCSDVTAMKAANGLHPAKVNGSKIDACYSEFPAAVSEIELIAAKQLRASSSRLSEEKLRETFSRFGMVERIFLSAKPFGQHARHACIKFESSEGVHAALSSSEELRNENILICPSLTPHHLHSWVAVTTPETTVDSEGEAAVEEKGWNLMCTNTQDRETELVMRKLDDRLGKLFRSLPDGTLSVVVLPGRTSSHGQLPGLCFMEVKRGSS
uniref:RNA exonuclease 5-like n=1 Tax=Centroberyx gerrardi TaxID=166262 RepID=UPI003AAEF652